MNKLSTLTPDEYNRLACSGDAIINLLKKHANPLARPICKNKTKDKILNCLWMSWMLVFKAKLLLTHGSNVISRLSLNQLEVDKIIRLSHAVESNEKFFWKLIKGQRSPISDDRFLVNDTLSNGQRQFVKCGPIILKLWEPYLSMITLTTISSGDLCEPFVYEEVESVCASLKAGISGVMPPGLLAPVYQAIYIYRSARQWHHISLRATSLAITRLTEIQ